MYWFKRHMLAAMVAALAPPCLLADDNLWIVAVGAQADADGSSSFLGSFDWGVTEKTWLNVSAGGSRSPSDRADVDTRSFRLGIDHRFGKVGVTAGVERWGEEDEVESGDIEASIYFRNDSFSLGVLGERRDIDITFTVAGLLGDQTRRTVGLTADGWGLRASARAGQNWRLFAVGRDYSYSRDLTVLPRLDRFDFLATSALTLANSFVDFEATAGIERRFGNVMATATFGRDRSAVDRSELDTLGISVLFPIGFSADLEVNLGLSDGDDFGTDVFGGLFLFLYGGS